MATVKTAISLQQPLFERVDTLADTLHISRSRLFVLAIEDFLHRYENQRLLDNLNVTYDDFPDAAEQQLQRQMRVKQRTLLEDEW